METEGRRQTNKCCDGTVHRSEFKHEAHVLFCPSFIQSQKLDVCQGAQLVKSARRGIPKTPRDVMRKRNTNTRSEVLIAY